MFLKLFFLWAPGAAIAGFLFDVELSPLRGYIVPLLMVVMLCMGLTLRPSDFINITQYKTAILAGMALQFTIMPLMALLIAHVFGLSRELTVGLQNSGLATALALKFFSPLAALPGAIFSIWLNITGSVFASICLRFDKKVKDGHARQDNDMTSKDGVIER
jgi:predicted Na+-dependent transporter